MAELLFRKALKYRINNVYTAFIIILRLSEIELMKGNFNEALRWLKSIENLVKSNSEMTQIINEKKKVINNLKIRRTFNIRKHKQLKQ